MRNQQLIILVSICLAAGVATAQDYRVDGRTLTITTDGQSAEVPLSCSGSTVLVHEAVAYVACGAAGAVVVDLGAGKEIGRRDMGGTVTGFFVVDGTVWAQVQRLEARPVVQGDPRTGPVVVAPSRTQPADPPQDPKTTGEPKAEDAPLPEAEVVEIRSETVIVGLGAEHGIKRGSHIEIFVRRDVEFGGESTVEEEQILIGKVSAVSATRCEVRLGVNERVPAGALARPNPARLTSNRVSPPRLGNLWEFIFTARPFLALGTFGFGTISDATVRRRFDGPWSAELRLEPLGLGFADEGNIVAASGNVIGSYDTRLFSVGLGLGWAAINDSLQNSLSADANGNPVQFDRVRSGLSLAQAVRLGSLDGLHLAVLNSFLFYQSEFNYGGTTATLQIPAGDTLWVFGRGGGGAATGYAFGEIGLRVRLLGAGDSGSLFLSPSVGGGALFGEKDCDDYEGCVQDVSYGGPLVGLGVEWRQ